MYNGCAQYICSTHSGISGKFTPEQLFDFAERAVKALKCTTLGAYMSEGVSRVDIFVDNNNQMVVNEFEHIDASYASTGGNEAATHQFSIKYYEKILQELICCDIFSY